MTPQASYTIFTPDSWSYNLWTDIFVAPIVDSGVTQLSVTFPSGNNWLDWWDSTKVYQGGNTVNYAVPSLAIFPVFHRQGSILALNVTTDDTGHGRTTSAGSLTLLISQMDTSGSEVGTIIREFSAETEGKVLAQEVSYFYDTSN